MDNYELTIYPRCVVVLGDIAVQPISVSIQKNNELEQDTCDIVLNEHFLSDTVQNKLMLCDENRINIEVWCGYLSPFEKDEFEDYTIDNKDKYKKFMFKRFEGLVVQPDWSYSQSSDTLSLHCQDWTYLLTESSLIDTAEASQTTAAAIIDKFNSLLKGKMSLNYNSEKDKLVAASTFLGTKGKDKNGKESYQYSMANRRMWDVILDIVKSCHFDMLKRGKQIYLGIPQKPQPPKVNPNRVMSNELSVWEFQYGKHFTELQFRRGQKGSKANGNIYVKVTSTTPQKRGPSKLIFGEFPSSSKKVGNTTEVERIEFHVAGPTDTKTLNAIARFIGEKQVRKNLTGTMKCQFAYPYIYANDGLRIFSRDPKFVGTIPDQEDKLNHISSNEFRIKGINEAFSEGSYTQSVEFELDFTRDAMATFGLGEINKRLIPEIKRKKLPAPKSKATGKKKKDPNKDNKK